MHLYYEVKDMLHKELEDIVRQGDISNVSVEMIDKLLNSIKNSCKIIMYEEYSDGGYSYDDGYSNARGRGRNAKRDSMGRYAREGGYSNRRGYSRADGYNNGYSYADGDNEEKMQMLEELMQDARTEQEKSMLRSMMNKMQNS